MSRILITLKIRTSNYKDKNSKEIYEGQCIIYDDYSYSIKTNNSELRDRISNAIDEIKAKGEALYKYEEKEGDKFIMYGKKVTPEDENFIHGLIRDAVNKLNRKSDSDGEIISLDYS